MNAPARAPRGQIRILPWVYLGILAWAGIYICREAFLTESTGHFNSMHGEWMALARLGGFHFWSPSWWRWWGNGVPLEYTYAPLTPVLTAAIAHLTHSSYALAFNQLTGLVYCLTPLFLYLAAWKLSGSAGYSFAAALACSLLSPITLLAPDTTFRAASVLDPRRLFLMFEWDDLPHVMAITLLPVAVWFLYRALTRAAWFDAVAAGLALAGMMLANMFGLVLAGLVALTVPLTIERRPRLAHFTRSAVIGVGAWIAVCAWLPPSLLLTIHSNSILSNEASRTGPALAAFAVALLVCVIMWAVGRRFAGSWAFRWLLLFGCLMVLIPLLDRYAGLHFVPQPVRYKIEADLAIVWIVVFLLRLLIGRIPASGRALLVFVLLVLAARQVIHCRRYAKPLLRPVDTAQSIEYRASAWIAKNLPGRRVMLPGSVFLWADAFANIPQVGAEPYTTTPDWSEHLATYIVDTGQNAGKDDAAVSILWLKAFGAQAVVVPGPQSPEYWKPFVNPRKFDGVLPVLWRERDTTIYRVSDRPYSLAHVLRPEALVHHAPVNGLDTAEIRRYVAALEDPAAPAATWDWQGDDKAVIEARLEPGQIVSAQITYAPGWHARVNGSARPIRPDGLGLMAVDPRCSGDCTIALEYDGGAELRTCRAVSAGFSVWIAGLLVYRGWRRRAARRRNDG